MIDEYEGVPIRKLKPDNSTYNKRVSVRGRAKAGGIAKQKGDNKLNKKIANNRRYHKGE